ncbi:MAG: MurR/RpiR family transcriptional regulator [Culicoidibacterales bacterium]
MQNLENLVNRQLLILTTAEKDIYELVRKQPEIIPELTIDQLSKQCFVSKSTILRFTKKIGFRSFSEFKYFISQNCNKTRGKHDGNLGSFVQQMHDNLVKEDILLLKSFLGHAKSIFLVPTGIDQHIQAENFSNKLLKKRIISCVIPISANSELTKYILDNLNIDEIVVIFSSSGDNLMLMEHIKNAVSRGIKIISFTAAKNNYIKEISDINFCLGISPIRSNFYSYSSGLSHLLINLVLESMEE